MERGNKSGGESRYGESQVCYLIFVIHAIKSDKLLDPIMHLFLKNLMKPKWFVIFVMRD